MLSKIAICNAALAKLGERFIIDLEDESKQARALNEAFPRIRDSMLRSNRWSFAMTRASLSALNAAPVFEYPLQYQIPTDCLRLDYIGDFFVGLTLGDYRNQSASEYKIEGRKILTDLKAPLHIRYVRQEEDTTIYDPLFDEALSCKLAVELANTLTQSDNLKNLAMQEFKAVMMSAIRMNAIEKAPEPLASETWEMARI